MDIDKTAGEEFLFGRLSIPAGRVEEARSESCGFFDLATLEPLDPRPGEPIRLRFRCGIDLSLRQLRIFWTNDGSHPIWNGPSTTQHLDAQPLPPVWDTLTWGYRQDWQAILPAQADATILRYVAVGVDSCGRTLPCPWPGRDRHGSPHVATVTVDRLDPPTWLRQAVIYQVFVDRFAPSPGSVFASADDLDARLGGTLWGLIERLDHLVHLGVDTLWLSPIFASPNYHGYAVRDFYQVEPALGGDEAWQQLVDACRQRGLRIVLDFVANHLSDRHPAFVAALDPDDLVHRRWFRFRRWPDQFDCFFAQPHQPELDGEQPHVRDYLNAAAVYWLRLGCDGYRLDHAHGLSHGFWSEFRAATRSAAPHSVCFGEVTHTPQTLRSYAGRMDGLLDFPLCMLLRDTFARAEISLSHFDRRLCRHLDYLHGPMVMPSFLDNHDMNRFLITAGGDVRRLKVAALVQFLLPGPPIIYYGTEIGLSQRRPLGRLEESRLPMPPREQWDHDLRDFYRLLIRLRRRVAAHEQRPLLLWVDDDARCAAWQVGAVVLVVNLGASPCQTLDASRLLLATDPTTGPHLPAWSAAVLEA